ncbi:MAG: Quinoprotein glucose dehydrogenase [Acidobacteria bacterium]|nr:Quinoprotein glucose dehydrogenase [Acidobacteriota bacterium]
MRRLLARSLLVLVPLVLIARHELAGQPAGLPSTNNGDWTHYTADMRGTKYSPLDQISAANFNQLEESWRFKTDNLGTRPEFKLEGTPLAI